MSSHFSDIGFNVTSDDELRDLAFQAYEEGELFPSENGAYVQWSPGQGVELWTRMDRNGDVIGINPHFAGTTSTWVGITERIQPPETPTLDGSFYAWANPSEEDPGTGDFPFVFDVPDYRLYDAVNLPRSLDVQLGAFALELNAYESDEAYDAAQGDEIKFASESFIPCGLFTPGPGEVKVPEAYVMFSGHVLHTETRANPVTGNDFRWVKVQTLLGEIDVVSDPTIVIGELVVGGVVNGSFWLSGRLLNYLSVENHRGLHTLIRP